MQAERGGLRTESGWLAREAEWVAGKAIRLAREVRRAEVGEKRFADVKNYHGFWVEHVDGDSPLPLWKRVSKGSDEN